MNNNLNGKIAVITGGARGIGLEVAKRFSDSGAKVAIWDIHGASGAANDIEGAIGVEVDVSDASSIEQGLNETKKLLGKVDILVTSAGMTGPTGPVDGYPIEEWQKVVNVHLIGGFLCCRAVLPDMKAADYGRIVMVSSVAGKEGNANASSYSAAKAGIIGLVKSLGKEMAETGVRVNCIAPGLIDTPLMQQLPKEQVAWSLDKIPQGRFGTVEEAASLISWLSSEECSFNSGAVFDLSGGRATY